MIKKIRLDCLKPSNSTNLAAVLVLRQHIELTPTLPGNRGIPRDAAAFRNRADRFC